MLCRFGAILLILFETLAARAIRIEDLDYYTTSTLLPEFVSAATNPAPAPSPITSPNTTPTAVLPAVPGSIEVLPQDTIRQLRANPLVPYPRDKTKDLQMPYRVYTVDMDANPNYDGPIDNTRFMNVYNLEDVVDEVLRFKASNPGSNPWAIFDMDETLTLAGETAGTFHAIHPETSDLLKNLKDQGVKIVLLSTSGDPKQKFEAAGQGYDGIVDHAIFGISGTQSKGEALKEYIGTETTTKPSHIFFTDDKDGEGYLLDVEKTATEVKIPFTTFHFKGYHLKKLKIAASRAGKAIVEYMETLSPKAKAVFQDALYRESKIKGIQWFSQNPDDPFASGEGRYFTLGEIIQTLDGQALNDVLPQQKNKTKTTKSLPRVYTVDMESQPHYSGEIDNTRFTNVYNLEDIIEYILSFKQQNPDSNPLAVFDVDQMLVAHDMFGRQLVRIHPHTNALLQRLKDADIPVILLSAGSRTDWKFQQTGLDYTIIAHTIDGLNRAGQEKGAALRTYIDTLKSQPTHVFFSDDYDKETFIPSVEAAMSDINIPFTTFHFQGHWLIDRKLGNAVHHPHSIQREAERRGVTIEEYLRIFQEASIN